MGIEWVHSEDKVSTNFSISVVRYAVIGSADTI
jgi:hypothetical protein